MLLNKTTWITIIYTNKKKTRSVCPICPAMRFAVRWSLMLKFKIVIKHIFLGSIGVKITKKVTLIFEKTVKNRSLLGYLPLVAVHRIACVSRVLYHKNFMTPLWTYNVKETCKPHSGRMKNMHFWSNFTEQNFQSNLWSHNNFFIIFNLWPPLFFI